MVGMMASGKVTVTCFLLSLVTLCQSQTTSYPTKDLYDYCGNSSLNTAATSIVLPCAIDGYERAGKLTFHPFDSPRYPLISCNFSLTVDSSRCSSTKNYAIYFNIRDLALAGGDRIDVYENLTLVKRLPGGYHYYPSDRNPRSFGQLLSNYSRTPTLNFRFLKNTTRHSFAHGFATLDYVVLREDYDPTKETACNALRGGSLLDAHYCERGDRVNCPSTYIPQIGLNPVSKTEVENMSSSFLSKFCYQYGSTRMSSPMDTGNDNHLPTDNHNHSGVAIYLSLVGLVAVVFVCVFVRTFRKDI